MIKEFNTKSNFKAKSIVNKSSYFNFTSQLSKVRKNKVSLFQIIRLLAKLKYKNRQRTRYGLENKRSAFFSALIFTLIFEYTVGFEDSYSKENNLYIFKIMIVIILLYFNINIK